MNEPNEHKDEAVKWEQFVIKVAAALIAFLLFWGMQTMSGRLEKLEGLMMQLGEKVAAQCADLRRLEERINHLSRRGDGH